MAIRWLVLLVALSLAVAVIAQSSNCREVPQVQGVDQSPTQPADWGKCTSALDSFVRPNSHWCKAGQLGVWPGPPTARAQQCLKFGRASIYRGPIYGSSAAHKAACNQIIRGDNKAAMIAVSTKYLKTSQGGWVSDKGSCGKCMCVRMHGGDVNYNRGLQKERASRHIGLTFLGKVGDRCGECPDDHIDILQDRPFSWAPFDPNRKIDNQWAPFVNAKDGPRGFRDQTMIRGSGYSPEAVGTWLADWQWVPCEGWSHQRCGQLMRSMGYNQVFTPSWQEGLDSYSMRPVSSLRGNPYTKEPWT